MGSGGVETPTLTPDDIAELKAKIEAKEIALTSGHHNVVTEHEACAMDLIVWKATGAISDTAECVHPLIASHIHALNDAEVATSKSRWELVEHAGPDILGTAGLPAAHVQFALMGVTTGIQLATNLAKLKTDGAPSVLIEWIHAQGPTTGNRSAAATTGNGSAAVCFGMWGKAKAGLGGSIVLAWFDGTRQRIAVGYPGEDGIEADTWYRCDDAGKLVEVTP